MAVLTLLQLVGFALIVIGAAMAWPPLGVLLAGVGLLGYAVLAERSIARDAERTKDGAV